MIENSNQNQYLEVINDDSISENEKEVPISSNNECF